MNSEWNTFAAVCKEEFHLCTFQSELLQQCAGLEDVAWAVFYHARENALLWLSKNVPALEGKKPIVLIAEGRADAVRGCLWRMP